MPYLEVQGEEYTHEKEELNNIEHDNIEQPAVIDVLGQLVCLEEVQADFANHVDDVDYLISLTPQFNVGLL